MKGVHFMKRLFILTLVFILCTTIFIVPISAEAYDPYDSRYITLEEETQLDLYDDLLIYDGDKYISLDCTIIKLYYGMFLYRFEDNENIMNMIEKAHIHYMIVPSSGDIFYKVIRDGKGDIFSSSEGAIQWSGFYTYTQSPELVFDFPIKINKIYCLDSFGNPNGGYIYYETDHGEYILFQEHANSKDTYLFPLSDFYEFIKFYINVEDDIDQISYMKSYSINDAPHAVPHPDSDNDGKCDACGGAIPEDNDPFPHIETDKSVASDTDNDIKEIGCGSCESSLTFPAVTAVGIMGTAIVLKKPKKRLARKKKR